MLDFIPVESFDIDRDCRELREALSLKKPDKKAIIRVFSKRTAQQRKLIIQRYSTLFLDDLVDLLGSKLHGNFRNLVLAMCHTVAELDAMVLKRAMDSSGPYDNALIHILCCRNNNEIQDIRKEYFRLFDRRDLLWDIVQVAMGDELKLFIGLLKGKRRPNLSTTLIRCPLLLPYSLRETRFNTLYGLLVDSSENDVRATIEHQEATLRMSFSAILDDLVSDRGTRNTFNALASYLTDAPAYFAKLLRKSVNGLGTNEFLLNHTLLSRRDIDLAEIKQAFKTDTGEDLYQWIEYHTSGHYREMLLALVGR